MMQPSVLFEIFLREGIDNSNFTRELSNSLAKDTKIRKYKLDLPFHDLFSEIQNGDTPYIIFLDEIIKLSYADLQSIIEFLQSNENIVGLTFYSDALKKVYGFQDKEFILKWFSRKPRTAQILPSWFCVLNREYLKKCKLLEVTYQSLEFFLLEISEYFANTSEKIFLLNSTHFNVDSLKWAKDIILMNSRNLALDYNNFSKRFNESKVEVPSQFKIEVSGEYALLPSNAQLDSQNSSLSDLFFSVICPAYKSNFFEEMVQSVINQTWQNWELIVLIDGPPEEEKERITSILKKFSSDIRIRFYYQENQGTGPARRRLAQMAKGDFVVTIDDDDMFHTDTLETFAHVINHYPDGFVFRGGTQLFGLIDLYLRPRQRIIINSIPSDLFEATQPFAINRKVLEDLGGFVGDKCFREAGEDSDIFIKIDKAKIKTYLIDKVMYSRRISTLNQTLSLRRDECMDHIHSLISRHCLSDWYFSDILFQKDGPYINATTSYKHFKNGNEVVAATKFFDYQTIGDCSNVLIDLEITSSCNANCVFCPRDVLNRENKFVSLELINVLADQISKEKGIRQVILCGIGEPTLHPELESIVKTLVKTGARVCITTNGSLMNLDKFNKLADLGVVEFNFSLNAVSEETYSKVMKTLIYKRVKNNLISILKQRKKSNLNIEINVSFVLCNDNQHEIFSFVEEWRRSGVSKIWIHPTNFRAGLLDKNIINVDIGKVQSKFANDDMVIVDVFQHVSENGKVCKIAQNLDFISVDGDMLLCALDYKKSNCIGNLKTSNIQQMHLEKFLKYNQGMISTICYSCDFLPKNIIQ